jgi:Domain of unknown function (DUF5615)
VSLRLRFLADENFNNDILNGALRRLPELDVVRVQDIGLVEEPDPVLLAWAAQEGRILLTHDVRTMPSHAYARLGVGERIAGDCIVPDALPVGEVIEELLLIAQCGVEMDWIDRVRYLPL